MENKIITGYKAFNHDLTCLGFQYEVGKTYNYDGVIKMCENGFHFCPKSPFDVFSYYQLIGGNGELRRFARVSCPVSKAINSDKKIVTAEITIEEELSLSELVEAQVKDTFVYLNDFSRLSTTGNYSQVAATDYGSYLAATGERSRLAAAGDGSHLATTGDYSQVATNGDYSQVTATGYGSRLSTTGNYSQVAATGYGLRLSATGERSRLAATGDDSLCIVKGQNGVISISGKGGSFKGENGTYVAIADFDEKGECIGFVTGCVGKAGLKANICYTVSNGKFVECEVQSC